MCVTTDNTKLNAVVPRHVGAKSRVNWSRQRVIDFLEKEIQALRMRKSLKKFWQKFPSKEEIYAGLRRLTSTQSWSERGVSMDAMMAWSRLMRDRVVCSVIDKESTRLLLMCPKFYQERCFKAVIGSPFFTWKVPDENMVLEEIKQTRQVFAYTNAKVKKEGKHKTGMVDVWPKKSDPWLKVRVTASFKGHALAKLYSLAGRALIGAMKTISSVKVRVNLSKQVEVVAKFHEHNLQCEEFQRGGKRTWT